MRHGERKGVIFFRSKMGHGFIKLEYYSWSEEVYYDITKTCISQHAMEYPLGT
jgi:hypothetical protein